MKTTPATLPDGVAIPVERRLDGATIPLSSPVRHGERELSQLVLAPLAGVHVRSMPESWSETGSVMEFAGLLSGLPPSVLDQLVARDVGELVRRTWLVAWPMLDLPVQWEAVWAAEAEEARAAGRGGAPRALPEVRGGHVLELESPIVSERDSVSRLTFAELTGRVARRCPTEGLSVSRLPWLVEELTGAPRAVVDQLRGRDLNRALALAQLFFLAIRGTTGTSG